MAKQRYISSDFWTDSFVQDITNIDKLLFIYLFTNNHVDLCGIYEITLKTISFESGIDIKSVSKALEGFSAKKKVLYQNGWIKLVNFQKHLKTNPNIQKGVERSLSLIPSDIVKGFERLSKGSLPIPIPVPILIPIEKEISKNKNTFTPPLLADVKNYFNEKASEDQSERFWNFYDSKNWMVGKNKMGKWKSAVSGWIDRNDIKKKTEKERLESIYKEMESNF